MLLKIGSLFKSVTSIHGTNQFARLNRTGSMIWAAIMIANLMLTISYLFFISNRYRNNQIVTKINSSCKINQIPFPAVSICNFNIVSETETKGVTRILMKYNRTQQEIELFLQSLPRLRDFNNNSGISDDFTDIMEILESHYFNVDAIMAEVHQKCENLLLYCSFNRKIKDCGEIFNLIKTYDGHCCTFNYAALNDDNDKLFANDDDVNFYVDPSTGDEMSNLIVTAQTGSGTGLNVVFNVEINDYPSWSSVPYNGAKILITDPNDYPETTMLYKYAIIGESLEIKVEPMVFQSDDEIRRVPVEIRGCLFHDEILLEHSDRYSMEMCKTECKIKKYLENCGCVPYKYPSEKSSRMCQFKDLACLSDLRAHKFEHEQPCLPPCLLECRDKKYRITSDVMPLVPDFYPESVTHDRNVSELAALQVYYSKSTCNCYKQTLLMDYNYFIATYGGVFSLSFGVSILTVFEITFVLISRIVQYIIPF